VKKLTTVQAVSENPDEWIGIDELFKEWDVWDTVKI